MKSGVRRGGYVKAKGVSSCGGSCGSRGSWQKEGATLPTRRSLFPLASFSSDKRRTLSLRLSPIILYIYSTIQKHAACTTRYIDQTSASALSHVKRAETLSEQGWGHLRRRPRARTPVGPGICETCEGGHFSLSCPLYCAGQSLYDLRLRNHNTILNKRTGGCMRRSSITTSTGSDGVWTLIW